MSEIVTTPAYDGSRRHFIFRPDGTEVEVEFTDTAVHSSKPLTLDEVNALCALRPYAPWDSLNDLMKQSEYVKAIKTSGFYPVKVDKWYRKHGKKRQYDTDFYLVQMENGKKRFVPKHYFK